MGKVDNNITLDKCENCNQSSESLLACISKWESSTKVIKTAYKMAKSSEQSFIALYVESTEVKLDKDEKKQLEKNFEFAKKLGAEVVTIHGDNIVEQILRFAKLRDVEQIVVGKYHIANRKIYNIFKKDLADKLIEEAEFADIHVIPYNYDKTQKSKVNHLIYKKDGLEYYKIDLIKVIVINLITTVLIFFFKSEHLREENILLTYLLSSVVVSITTKSYISVFLGAILNILSVCYLFAAPVYNFYVYNSTYFTNIIAFTIVGVIISGLTSRIKNQAKIYSKREENTQILYQISRSFLRLLDKDDIIQKGMELLSLSLNRDIICYVEQNSELLSYNKFLKESNKELEEIREKEVAKQVFNKAIIAGEDSTKYADVKGYYMPIVGRDNTIGVIGILCNQKRLNEGDLSMIEAVVAQMAIALDRQILANIQKTTAIEIESERLRSSLLRAISHDLRTPLAGILGSVTTILNNQNKISKEETYDLLNGVQEDSQWLIRLVENLLNMTRMDEGRLELNKTVEIVEEIISDSLSHIRWRLDNIELIIDIPDDILFIPMDAKLIEQVIVNLIDNSIKYAGPNCKINVGVYEKDNYAYFEIKDNGPGIKKEHLKNIFDRFYTGESRTKDSRKGIGLGLSICKSIIQAHNGKIEVENDEDGGAKFTFSLPK